MERSLVRSVSNILPAHGERRGKGSCVSPRGEEEEEVRLIRRHHSYLHPHRYPHRRRHRYCRHPHRHFHDHSHCLHQLI